MQVLHIILNWNKFFLWIKELAWPSLNYSLSLPIYIEAFDKSELPTSIHFDQPLVTLKVLRQSDFMQEISFIMFIFKNNTDSQKLYFQVVVVFFSLKPRKLEIWFNKSWKSTSELLPENSFYMSFKCLNSPSSETERGLQ